MTPARPHPDTSDRPSPQQEQANHQYHGFSLRSVTWGYRDIFQNAIDELLREGHLGPQRQEVTREFFGLLKQADRSCFDHVLKQFLGALRPGNRWILGLPGLFSDLVELGGLLAGSKLYYGIRFFEAIAEGRLGASPSELRTGLQWIRRLREVDEELAVSMLAGYGWLRSRLQPDELEQYVDVALQISRRDPQAACRFLRGELPTSETYIRAITQECRLADVTESLRAMIGGLTGRDCPIEVLSQLDSDDLLERGTTTLTLADRIYLPERFRRFDTAAENRNWYRLSAVAAAGMLLDDSFPVLHGRGRFDTCTALTGDETWRVNLLVLVEWLRVLRRCCIRWPGAEGLIRWGLEAELSDRHPTGYEHLLREALAGKPRTGPARTLRDLADASENCVHSAELIDGVQADEIRRRFPSLTGELLRPMGFLSDFLFPVSFSPAASGPTVADLRTAAGLAGDAEHRQADAIGGESGHEEGGQESDDGASGEPAFLYPEWDCRLNEYLPDWCHLRERRVEPAATVSLDKDWLDDARKVRTVFERLKPDETRREKRLPDGDEINPDLLVTHMIDRQIEPSPPVRFYEKPLVRKRDLAALILLDVSGSTGEQVSDRAKVLDVEKRAVVILGQGLSALDDRFSVCGFSSNGRERCEFFVFKRFDESWTDAAIERVMAAWSRNSTRMGPALRHAGQLLSDQPARQRLILLVTDGKPMDQGYDPATRYAQHDVRMACEENARLDVHTFAISTEENSLPDMEIMFPHRRFVILPSIRHLPRLLPEIYLRLTL